MLGALTLESSKGEAQSMTDLLKLLPGTNKCNWYQLVYLEFCIEIGNVGPP